MVIIGFILIFGSIWWSWILNNKYPEAETPITLSAIVVFLSGVIILSYEIMKVMK